ncbi:restriction endonuclease subunit S [Moraxella atlantae]|uniref:restriction endonuclease subunit S n=1 Tax=Faucicola atlantae TaxID=34059 RepID=UPI0037514AE3
MLEEKKLEDLVDNYNFQRVPLSSSQRENLEKIYPYYGAQGIIDYVEDYIFDGEFILVAEDGENLKSQKNNVCTFATGKFWVNNHAHIIKANSENDNKYIFYKLNQIDFKRFVTGSAQPKLTKDNLNSIKLNVHKFAEQQKIASVLSTLDDKIALNNQINATLEQMAKTLYDYWFVQFDFPDDNGKPYKSSGGEMVYNDILKREIPKGWESSNILKVADLLGGGTPRKDNPDFWNGNIPFFTPTDCDNSVFVLKTSDNITDLGLSKSSTKLFKENTIFITARGSVGRMSLNAVPMAMNQSCYALQPKEKSDYSYLFFLK